MQKNKKNGFLFFDLLVALIIVMLFITFVTTTTSLLMYYYTIHKEYIVSKNILSDLLYEINTGNSLPSETVKTVGLKDFTVTISGETLKHALVGTINEIKLIVITISWTNFFGNREIISLKTLDLGKTGLVEKV